MNKANCNPFLGNWIPYKTDERGAVLIDMRQGKLDVDAYDVADGEHFEVQHLAFSRGSLTFQLRIHSTGVTNKNYFRIVGTDEAVWWVTYRETWKLKSRTDDERALVPKSHKFKFIGVWEDSEQQCPTNIRIERSGVGVSVTTIDLLRGRVGRIKNQHWKNGALCFASAAQRIRFPERSRLMLRTGSLLTHEITIAKVMRRVTS